MVNKFRVFLPPLIIALFILAFYFLSLKLLSQIFLLKGSDSIKNQQYVQAVDLIKKAIKHEPGAGNAWMSLGDAYHYLAEQKSAPEAFSYFMSARNAYRKAVDLTPLEPSVFFNMAMEEAKLSHLFHFLNNAQEKNPYDPIPYFLKAIEFYPNYVFYHYELVKFLFPQQIDSLFFKTISSMAYIYPEIYDDLSKEAFWFIANTPEAFTKGLDRAIQEGIHGQNAYRVMSSFFEDREDFKNAIHYFESALRYPTDVDFHSLIHFGWLYLKDDQFEKAKEQFADAFDLASDKIESLERLFWLFKKEDALKEYSHFIQKLEAKTKLPLEAGVFLGRSLVELNEFKEAKQVLISLNEKKMLPESFYLLSKIAEKENDLDNAERYIQKATVLDPENDWYHLRFSEILKKLDKIEAAEKASTVAIEKSEKPRAWMYNHRGWIRWDMKDYLGAFEDWKISAVLEPENKDYNGQIAEALYKMGRWKESADYLKKAMDLDPENKEYRQKYSEIINHLKKNK